MSKEDLTPKEVTRILIVDDSEYLRREISNILGESGYNVVAESGTVPEAIEAMSHAKPNLAIIDLIMPDISGIELMKHIKDNYANVSLVLTTPISDGPYIQEALAAGVLDILVRPIDSETLLGSVDRIARQILDESSF